MKWKNVWIGISAVFAFMNVAYAERVCDEWVVPQFDNRNWVARQITTSKDTIVSIAYLLKNESAQSWTEMVSTKSYRTPMPPSGLVRMHDYFRDSIFKDCANKNWTTLYKADSQIISSWDQNHCTTSNNTGYTLANFILGRKGIHIVYYSAKDKKVFDAQMPIWIAHLKKANVFNPNRSSHAYPAGFLSDTMKMINISFRFSSPSYKPGDFIATPRKVWRSGTKYARNQESLDTAQDLHMLSISNAPDLWVINLFDSTGAHLVDPGPTYNVICPVIEFYGESGVMELEFGSEQSFFDYYGARPLPNEKLNAIDCKVWELPRLQTILRLYVRTDTNLPYAVKSVRSDGFECTAYYDEYVTGLPLDRSLFAPVKNINYKER